MIKHLFKKAEAAKKGISGFDATGFWSILL
jgi:hypothetical protein